MKFWVAATLIAWWFHVRPFELWRIHNYCCRRLEAEIDSDPAAYSKIMDSALMRRYDAIYNRIHEWRNERARQLARNTLDVLVRRQIPLYPRDHR